MTSIKLAYVHEFCDRHGIVRRYFRRPGFKQLPLPGLPGSAEFMAAYQAALECQPLAIGAKRTKPGSVNAALAGYYTSLEFRSLAAGTQAMRRAILERFRRDHGDKSIATLPPKFIAATLGKMQPHAARNWLKAVRALAQFCLAQEMLAADPTQGIKLPRIKSDGHHSWNEPEIAQFEAAHGVGTKPRLALALGLYTVQRRGDVIRMGRQHINNGVIHVRQEKTGTTLRIPLHPALQAVLAATPTEHLTLLVTKSGRPYSGNDFSEQFRAWCNEAGLPARCTFHGLRKAGCTRLAEAGCSANEIASISGHATLREVERYTKAAEQERMARNAMARTTKTENEQTSGNLS
jgi:integrase